MNAKQHHIRESYDRVAAEYAARIYGELAHKPFDRDLLDRFAAIVRPIGPACDLGCGPGEVARYLHDRGLPVVGIDPSPAMLDHARRLNPGIEFHEGAMPALPVDNESLGGIAAFYSIIHIPRDLLPVAFADMQRTLRPGGALLLAFHIGAEDRHLDQWWGEQVSLDFYFFHRPEIERHLTAAGFVIRDSIERPPYPDVEAQTERAYILAAKPAAAILA